MTEIFWIHYHFKKKKKKTNTGSDPLLMACKSKAFFVKVAAHLLTLKMFWFQLVIFSLAFRINWNGWLWSGQDMKLTIGLSSAELRNSWNFATHLKWPIYHHSTSCLHDNASLHKGTIPIYIQQDATLHSLFISGNCCTCFGWYLHPSSGAHTTVSTASDACQ